MSRSQGTEARTESGRDDRVGAELTLPLLLAIDARERGLLSFVQQTGMVVLSELLAAEAAQIAGPKEKHVQ